MLPAALPSTAAGPGCGGCGAGTGMLWEGTHSSRGPCGTGSHHGPCLADPASALRKEEVSPRGHIREPGGATLKPLAATAPYNLPRTPAAPIQPHMCQHCTCPQPAQQPHGYLPWAPTHFPLTSPQQCQEHLPAMTWGCTGTHRPSDLRDSSVQRPGNLMRKVFPFPPPPAKASV